MDVANIKMSPYLETSNELRKQVPVYTSYDAYIDAEGNYYQLGDESPYQEQVDRYRGLAYANMKKMDFMMTGSYANNQKSADVTTPSQLTVNK